MQVQANLIQNLEELIYYFYDLSIIIRTFMKYDKFLKQKMPSSISQKMIFFMKLQKTINIKYY